MARKTDFNAVGKDQPRLDGAAKLTGRSEFADDVRLPGLLHGKIVRSPLARARIVNIDTSAAARLPGVKAIVTREDAPRLYIGMHQPLFDQTANYIGQEVAAVAALDEATAAEAASLIRVEYEPLPAITLIKQALEPGAAQLHPKAPGNVAWEQAEVHGDPDRAFAESHARARGRVRQQPEPQLLRRVPRGRRGFLQRRQAHGVDAKPDGAAVSEGACRGLRPQRRPGAPDDAEHRRGLHRAQRRAAAPLRRGAAVAQGRASRQAAGHGR